jgi:catalase
MSGTFQRLQESLNAAKDAASEKLNDVTTTNEKILDMWHNTVDYTKSDSKMTMDTGVKVQDTDHWLRVMSEKQEGPALLEDQIAREKITRCMCSALP